MPSRCRTPVPVENSHPRRSIVEIIAMRPFRISAERVQPHCQTTIGEGSSRRLRS